MQAIVNQSSDLFWANQWDSGNTSNGRFFHWLKFSRIPLMKKLKLQHFRMGNSCFDLGQYPRAPQLLPQLLQCTL